MIKVLGIGEQIIDLLQMLYFCIEELDKNIDYLGEEEEKLLDMYGLHRELCNKFLDLVTCVKKRDSCG